MKPEQVFRGQGGLYEVLVRGELYYVDPAVTFVIMPSFAVDRGVIFCSHEGANPPVLRIVAVH